MLFTAAINVSQSALRRASFANLDDNPESSSTAESVNGMRKMV
jgi:hypothetical protein